MPKARQQALLSKIADNPFEKRGIAKKKHDVFNRRVKGEGRNVAKARSEAIERRNKTLLVDYQRSKKANAFEDRRFGEGDAGVPVEEKMWARLQKERTRAVRSGRNTAFNLDDDDDDGGELLTHKGQALGVGGGYDSDSYAAGRGAGDAADDDEAGLNKEVVNRLHFGGGERDAGRPQDRKSRKDIMEEIIAKSKLRKADKSRSKDEQEETREKLDAEFGDLLGMLEQRPTRAATGEKARAPLDEYDVMTKELTFESRAQASDRTRTPEEIAKAEKEKLDELEKSRLRRMRGEDSGDEGDKGKTSRTKRQRNDDELGDDFALEPVTAAPGEQVENGNAPKSKKSKVAKGDKSDESGDGDESEGSSGSDEDGSEGAAKRSKAAREMPYVFPCPSTMEAFLELLAQHASSADDVNTVVERILKNHSVKLDRRNLEKMQNFYDVLLKRFQRLGDQIATQRGGPMDREKQLEFLTKALYGVTQDMPDTAGGLWHRLLGAMHRRLGKELRDRATGVAAESAPCWPSHGHRLLLKLLGDLFPTTDFRHPVTTPASLLLGQYLSQCPVETSADLAAGVFLSAIMLQHTAPAKRVAPEALSFLSGVIAQYAPRTTSEPATASSNGKEAAFTRLRAEPLPQSVSDLVATPALMAPPLGWLRAAAADWASEPSKDGSEVDSSTEVAVPLLRVTAGWSDDEGVGGEERSAFSVAALGAAYSSLRLAVAALSECPGLPEVLAPVQAILARVRPMDEPALPLQLQERHLALQEEMSAAVAAALENRTPLRWLTAGVKTVKALAPKFLETYNFGKDNTLDHDAAVTKQLKRQIKRERKGAIRELKRDADYLEAVRSKEKEDKDAERKKGLRANRTWLEQEQATWNQQVGSKSTRKLITGGGSSNKRRPKVGRGY
ncbi:nucleolar protein 14 [Tribonema minus]|uniref:Nucleolar protein 14 n=1 Tax=Tribonema minus TaxID=303371 RepID=A0A836CJL6_9STRA|nr:nucleolar protein 14 [Tribonema minus]